MAEASYVRLGADAWTLLAEALPGAPLPHPFRPHDGPQLDATGRGAVERALRDAELLTGTRGELLDELAPWLREGLLTLTRPSVVIEVSAGLGDVLRIGHLAIRGAVAAGIARSQRPTPDADELELGPIELRTLRAGDVVSGALGTLGTLDGDSHREPVAVPGDAVARALADDRAARARAAIECLRLPVPLDSGLRSVARVDVANAGGRRALMAVRTSGGWWSLARDNTLRPAGAGELAAELAAILADSG